jgi:hypothetical protein
MFRHTTEHLQAMASVLRSPGGQLFMEMLLDMAKQKDREARKLDGSMLYRAQGAADAYEQLAKDMHAALTRRSPAPTTAYTPAERLVA